MRRNNFPSEQIPQEFLFLSENLSASYYPGAAKDAIPPHRKQWGILA